MYDTILGLSNAGEQMNIRDLSWREACVGKRKKGVLGIVELFADLVMHIQLVYVCKIMESYVITKVFLTACELYVRLKSNFHVNMFINFCLLPATELGMSTNYDPLLICFISLRVPSWLFISKKK